MVAVANQSNLPSTKSPSHSRESRQISWTVVIRPRSTDCKLAFAFLGHKAPVLLGSNVVFGSVSFDAEFLNFAEPELSPADKGAFSKTLAGSKSPHIRVEMGLSLELYFLVSIQVSKCRVWQSTSGEISSSSELSLLSLLVGNMVLLGRRIYGCMNCVGYEQYLGLCPGNKSHLGSMVRLRCRGMDITNILPQTAAVSICRATGGYQGVDESSIASSPRYPQHLLCLVERSTWGERHRGLFLQSHA